jgi:hypothetical protein
MKLIAESEGASLHDAVRLVVCVTDMFRFRPIVNKVQAELWGEGPYPPRTIVEVHRLNRDDLVEVEGTFYAPVVKSRRQIVATTQSHASLSLLLAKRVDITTLPITCVHTLMHYYAILVVARVRS